MSDRFRPLLDELEKRPIGNVVVSPVFGRVQTHGAKGAEGLVVLGELLALPLNQEAAAPDTPDAA